MLLVIMIVSQFLDQHSKQLSNRRVYVACCWSWGMGVEEELGARELQPLTLKQEHLSEVVL